MRRIFGAAIALALSAAPAAAKDPPDFQGFWQLDVRPNPNEKELEAKLPPNTVVIHDTAWSSSASMNLAGSS